MNKFLSTLSLSLLFAALSFSQNAIKTHELDEVYWLQRVESNGVKLSNKYEGISLAYHKKDKNWLLYGNISSDKIILLNRFSASFLFNPERFVSLEYKDGKIYCCSTVDKKAEIRCGVFSWLNEQIKFLEETSYDPNPEKLKTANELLKAGKVKEAINAYNSINYLESYADKEKIGIEILLEAHKQGKNLESLRKFKEAKGLIELALGYEGLQFLEKTKSSEDLNQKFGKGLHGLSSTKFLEIMYDYAQWMMDGRLYEDYINLSGRLIGWDGKNPQIFLWRGDAFYAKREKEKYKEAYQKYIDLMTAAKKDKEINPLVRQRATVR